MHATQTRMGTPLRPSKFDPHPPLQDVLGWYVPLINRRGAETARARVSPEDVPLLASRRWCQMRTGYVSSYDQGTDATSYLHRLIMIPGDGLQVDHINGIRSDCRRENMRIVTFKENAQNKGVQVNNVTGVRGVHLDRERGGYKAQLGCNGKHYMLGRFDTIEEADAAVSALRQELMPYADESARTTVRGYENLNHARKK